MYKTPLINIIEKLENIPSATTRSTVPLLADLEFDPHGDTTGIVNIYSPRGYDVGSIPRGIPIYDLEEHKLSPATGERTELERLAWYVSYHYGRGRWGIFMTRSGIYRVANELIKKGYPRTEAIPQAIEFLMGHERTHFQTDLAITSLELATERALFVHAREKMRKFAPGYHLIEEGLANAMARRQLRAPKDAIDDYLDNSPVGYRDWKKYTPSKDPQTWKAILDVLCSYRSLSVLNSELAVETARFVAPKYYQDIPVYEVNDIPGGEFSGSYLMGPLPDVSESDNFRSDLQKLAAGDHTYFKKWKSAKEKLANGNQVGVHLEIINRKKRIYSVRLDREARAALQQTQGWSAIAADHHDTLYRRLKKLT
jgi:hypothetical protein